MSDATAALTWIKKNGTCTPLMSVTMYALISDFLQSISKHFQLSKKKQKKTEDYTPLLFYALCALLLENMSGDCRNKERFFFLSMHVYIVTLLNPIRITDHII